MSGLLGKQIEESLGRILLHESKKDGSGVSWVVDVHRDHAKLSADDMTVEFHINNPHYSNEFARYCVGKAKTTKADYMRGIYFINSIEYNKPENKEAIVGQVIWIE